MLAFDAIEFEPALRELARRQGVPFLLPEA
jgi:hypothetical protein